MLGWCQRARPAAISPTTNCWRSALDEQPQHAPLPGKISVDLLGRPGELRHNLRGEAHLPCRTTLSPTGTVASGGHLIFAPDAGPAHTSKHGWSMIGGFRSSANWRVAVSLDAQFDQVMSCETREDLFTVASDGIARTVGTDGVRFAEFRMTPYVSFRVLRQDVTGPDLSPSMVNSPLQNPLIAHYHQTRHAGWISIGDLLPGRAWTEHPLYKEVYRPLRLRSHIATALTDNGSGLLTTAITVARGPSQLPSYSET